MMKKIFVHIHFIFVKSHILASWNMYIEHLKGILLSIIPSFYSFWQGVLGG